MNRRLKEISTEIYNSYNIKNELIKFKKIEDSIYFNSDLEELEKYLYEIEKNSKNTIDNYANYELSLNNSLDDLILRRIDNKLISVSNAKVENFEKRGSYFIMNFDINIYKLSIFEELTKNIDAKFLFLLRYNPSLSNNFKNNLTKKIVYLNPLLEEDYVNGKKIMDSIQEENELLMGKPSLIDLKLYKEILNQYIEIRINKLFEDILFNSTDINSNVKTLYLRSLLVYCSNENLKKIHDKLINKNIYRDIHELYFNNVIKLSKMDKELMKIKY